MLKNLCVLLLSIAVISLPIAAYQESPVVLKLTDNKKPGFEFTFRQNGNYQVRTGPGGRVFTGNFFIEKIKCKVRFLDTEIIDSQQQFSLTVDGDNCTKTGTVELVYIVLDRVFTFAINDTVTEPVPPK